MSKTVVKEWFSKTNDCPARLVRVINPFNDLYYIAELFYGDKWRMDYEPIKAFADILHPDNEQKVKPIKVDSSGYFAPCNMGIY